MSLSILVYLDPQSPLHNRHLLRSLQSQSIEFEVLIYHPESLELPSWLPESWLCQSTQESNIGQIWKQGFEKATGDYLAFFQSSALLNPDHFKLCLSVLQESGKDATFVRPEFIDSELFVVNEACLPDLQNNDWPGFSLASRLLWPIESFVFKKSSLDATFFEGISPLPSANDILNYLCQYALSSIPVSSMQLPVSKFWLAEMPEFRQVQVQKLLQQFDPEQLTPSYASLGKPSAFGAYQTVCQALRNQGLWQYLEAFQQKYLKEAQAAKTVLWLVHNDLEPWLPYVQDLEKQGYYPTIVIASERPSIQSTAYQVLYSQIAGVPCIHISGIPEEDRAVTSNGPPPLVKLVLELAHELRPDRIHLSSLKLYSLYLLSALERSNTPIYFSASDNSLSLPSQQLRLPETLSHTQPGKTAWLQFQNQILTKFIRHQAAKILVHSPEQARQLDDMGLQPYQYQMVTTAKELAHVYQQLHIIERQNSFVSSLSLLYHSRTGKELGQTLLNDLTHISTQGRILTYGSDVAPVMRALTQERVWVQGALTDLIQVQQGRSESLAVHLAEPRSLSSHVNYYDVLYSPYVLETLSLQSLRHFLTSAVLNLKKGSKWFLRLLNTKLLSSDQFWLNERHLRPYSPTLVKHLLQQIGFEITSSGLDSGPWKDYVLEAELKSTALPLLNVPVATQAYENYWEYNPPAITLNEQDKVLLIGPHIFKTWMIYRVQCEKMVGITTQVAELAKRQKRSNKFIFRHSSDILKTLSLLKESYDVIILQGLVETLSPDQLKAFLSLCQSKLSNGGRLHIQTMQLDSSEEDPLFWQSLLNIRPYTDLGPVLASKGFQVSCRETKDRHLTYECLQTEVTVPEALVPNLPSAVKAVMKHAKRVHSLENIAGLRQLTPHSQTCIFAADLLEQIPPALLPQALERIVAAIEPNGSFVLTFKLASDKKEDSASDKADSDAERTAKNSYESIWSDPQAYRPYPPALVDKLLQEAGLQKRLLIQHNHRWIWCGFKRLSYQVPDNKQLRLCWEGDVLNYHSLATVNRELLKQVLSETDYRVEIRNFSDPVFIPQPGSEDYPLWQHSYLPLTDSTQLTVRHHWPPDFSMPQNPGHWVMIQPWEFGSLPERWIYNMNKYVDQVWVPSEYVRQSYLRSGLLENKVAVVANGVNTEVYSPEAPPMILNSDKSFKFLFVGGGILRKGVDLLLNAFVEVFSTVDDVALVIKEFGAGKVYHTIEIGEWIERYQKTHPDMPEIIHLSEDLSPEQMPSLYTSCDCLVHPFRGEGFALPIAEAMACERSVLVTAYGPTLEYCDENNAYLIPAQEVPFKEKQIDDTLVTVDYPYWAEPDYDVLKALLRHIYDNQQEARQKAIAARETICQNWTWKHSLMQLETQVQALQQRPVYRFYREQILAETLGDAFENVSNQNYADAVVQFEKALQVDPYQPSVAYNLGVAYVMLEKYEPALNALTRSLRDGEITGDLCYAMGTVLRQLGDYPTSQQFFSKARELDPSLFG